MTYGQCINAMLTGETCWLTAAGVTFPVVVTAVSTRRNVINDRGETKLEGDKYTSIECRGRNGSGVYIVRQEQIDTDAQHHDKEFRKMEDTEDGREIGSTASVRKDA